MSGKNVKMANVNATLYDGDFTVCYDCVGEERCKLAIYYVEPPTDDDECTKRRSCNCVHPWMVKSALEALRDRLNQELKQFEGEQE